MVSHYGFNLHRLIINDFEYFFTSPIVIHVSSLVNYLFRFVAHFLKIGCLFFLFCFTVLVFYCCYNKLHKLNDLDNRNLLSYSSIGSKCDTDLTGLKSRSQLSYIPFWRQKGKNCFLVFSRF